MTAYIAQQYLYLGLVGGDYVVALLDEVSGLVEEQAEDVELVVAPFTCYLLESHRVYTGVYGLCCAAPEVMGLPRAAHYLVPVLLEYPYDEPVALDELVIGAYVLVGIRGIHDVAEPEDVVPVPALVSAVVGRHVAAAYLAELLQVPVRHKELLVLGQIDKGTPAERL